MHSAEPRLKPFIITAFVLGIAAAILAFIYGYHGGFTALNHYSNIVISAELWGVITIFGDALIYIAIAALISHTHRIYIRYFFIGGVIQTVLVNAIKHSTELDRPLGVLSPEYFFHYGPPHDWGSFPSGHTATAFLGCGLIIALSGNRLVNILAVTIAVMVGISRVALGVHWSVDILVGASIGLGNAALAVWLEKYFTIGRHKIAAIIFWFIMLLGCYQLFGHNGGYEYATWLSMPVAIIGTIGLLFSAKQTFRFANES